MGDLTRSGLLGLLLLMSGASGALAQDEEPEAEAPAEEPGAEEARAEEAPASGEEAAAPDGGPGRPVEEDEERYPAVLDEPPTPAITRLLAESGDGVPLYLVFEEMVEELIASLQDLENARISPLAVRRVQVSPRLSAWFADSLEAQIVAGLAEHTPLTVRRCVTCRSLRSRVEGDDWVVTVGIADQAGLRREAALLGVRAFLDIRAAYYPENNVASLSAEIFTAENGNVEWARSWRSNATTAAVLRTGERIETRAERVEELERRIDGRPYLSHQPFAGAAFIPRGGGGTYFGVSAGYRLTEHFGSDRRWLFSVGGSGFLNFEDTPLLGGFLNVALQYDVLPPNLNDFQFRTGPAIGAFFAGNEGNSFVAEWTLDGIFQFLLGVGISVFYFVPTEFAGQDLGGFGGKARFTINFR